MTAMLLICTTALLCGAIVAEGMNMAVQCYSMVKWLMFHRKTAAL